MSSKSMRLFSKQTGMNDLINLDRKNIWHPFTPLQDASEIPLITEARGVHLVTADGKKILDAVSSWWVNLHGHAHPRIARAISEQAARLEHVIFAGFTHEPAVRLSQNLLGILPQGHQKIFFSDDGSTAVEVGLKIAFQYWHNIGARKQKVIAIQGAYHGDTFGSMSVAERGMFTEPYHSFLFDTTFIDFPTPANEDAVVKHFKSLIDRQDVAAFIFEPLVQGAAGMRMYSPVVLDTLITYAQQQGVICIGDEVFTGFGRTGRMLASDYLKHKPDIIAVSKGITGGFLPLGVTSCSEKIISAFDSSDLKKTFFHGHSYTANPLACAAANASFDLLMEPECQENIRRIANRHQEFAKSLADDPNVFEARSRGTILAIELKTAEGSVYANPLRKRIYPFFMERGILLRPLGNVIYVLPPYVIANEELGTVYSAITEFLDHLKKGDH